MFLLKPSKLKPIRPLALLHISKTESPLLSLASTITSSAEDNPYQVSTQTTMVEDYGFTAEDLTINENIGYPKAYKKLCHDRGFGPYSHGPPFTFMPYALQENEAEKAWKLDQMFPIIDPKAKPTTNPKIFVSVLWKQLSHLGNAGFDPAVIRVDAYGNVLYYHSDSASPLNWGIDHWFPCSRAGLTVVSNLRILQRQACKRKKHKLEFSVPWWDFQLGISVNQFLSIFASSNSDFRHRAFSFLFFEGEDHEVNASKIVDSHSFPQHFFGLKEQVGLAPAAIVESRSEFYDNLALRKMDYNRKPRPMSPAIVASRKSHGNPSKENEDPEFDKNPYQAIVMARDSLKQREENTRVQTEIQKLDNEINEMKLTNEEEKFVTQDLELVLTKCRRKAEKCRRITEAQCSYRTMLEKMIRDTVYQSVIHKEHIRLNQAATNALIARLEAQKTIYDAAEKELNKMYKQRDELEKEIKPEWEHGRKRSRKRPRTSLHKELRVLLEEEQKASEENEEQKQEKKEEELKITADNTIQEKLEEHNRSFVALEEENSIEHKFEKLEISKGKKDSGISFPVHQETEIEEDKESRKQCGKGNVEKWLQILLENGHKDKDPQETNKNETSETEEINKQLNQKYPQQELKISEVSDLKYKEKQLQLVKDKNSWTKRKDRIEDEAKSATCIDEGNGATSFEGVERKERHKKEKRLVRSESARAFRRIPSSPSLLQGMRKGVDCIRKKSTVNGTDDGNGDLAATNNFFRSSIKTIKRAMKF